MTTSIDPTFEGDYVLADERPFVLTSGDKLASPTLHYALYGRLNARRDNAILICHALSGSARVGDWWPSMFEAGGWFDHDRACVLGINVLGSCYSSTGPRSINPHTGAAYGIDFPPATVRDMVRAQCALLNHLKISRLRMVVGASIGGMQALQWAIDFPKAVEHCIAIGAAPLSAMGLAFNHLQRVAIRNDPAWRDGRYPESNPPAQGLALARAIAMCSYKSPDLFEKRFARKPNRNGENPLRSLQERYDVAGYLDYQGEVFTRRFDARSYLILSKAMDTFDLGLGYESEMAALKRIRANVHLIGISSDWLFPPSDVRALADRMRRVDVRARYSEMISNHGHDAFLVETEQLSDLIRSGFERDPKRSGEKDLSSRSQTSESADRNLIVANCRPPVVG